MGRTDEDIARDLLRRRIEKIAAKLRTLADEVEDHARRVDGVGQRMTAPSSYAVLVSDVQHAIVNLLPNLHLSELVTDAVDADKARVRAKVAEEIAAAIEAAAWGNDDRYDQAIDRAAEIAREHGKES